MAQLNVHSLFPGLIRYIEYHAARVGSRWCHSGKLILGKLITPGATYEADIQSRQSENPKDPHTGRAVGMYIWDNPSLTISPRDETLNCGWSLIYPKNT